MKKLLCIEASRAFTLYKVYDQLYLRENQTHIVRDYGGVIVRDDGGILRVVINDGAQWRCTDFNVSGRVIAYFVEVGDEIDMR
jgi:hypothetical protein